MSTQSDQATAWALPTLLVGVLGALLVLTSQLRRAFVVRLVDLVGVDSGCYRGHPLRGSAISVVGGAVSLGVLVWMVAPRRGPEPRPAGPARPGRHRA